MRAIGRKAFTLIELLTVISIIAILASILFPTFAKAREKAEQTQCLSNVKQLGTAFIMYATDYDSRLPVIGTTQAQYGTGSWPGLPLPPAFWPATMNSYTKNDQILICPNTTIDSQSYNSSTNPTPTTGANGVSFGMNGGLDAAKITRITYPSSTVMVFDIVTDGGVCWSDASATAPNAPYRFRANHLGSDPGVNAAAPNGDGYGTICFADSHAKVLKASAAIIANPGSNDVRWTKQ
jgi:prepilin-type N-terminal cleavage/methylation domain-containing protein